MLIWIGREDAQKNAPTASNATGANAPAAASLDGGRPDYCPAAALGNQTFSDPPSPNAKTFATLAAKFALVGRELRAIPKAGRYHFEVRRWDQCFTCSTEADLHGLLRQLGAAA